MYSLDGKHDTRRWSVRAQSVEQLPVDDDDDQQAMPIVGCQLCTGATASPLPSRGGHSRRVFAVSPFCTALIRVHATATTLDDGVERTANSEPKQKRIRLLGSRLLRLLSPWRPWCMMGEDAQWILDEIQLLTE
jgi:hypothetical protein